MLKRLVTLGGAAVSVAALFVASAGAAPTTSLVKVSPANMHGWAFFDDNGHGGSGSLVSGPATPPQGVGSAQLGVTAANQGYALGYAGYGGTKLSDITSLSYSTYVQTGNNTIAPALQLNIDQDVTDTNNAWAGRLVYEPYYTHSVVDGQWQTWNTLDNAVSGTVGNWWFSNGALAASTGCTQAKPCTWSQVLAAPGDTNIGVNPGVPGVDFKAGSNWTVPFTGNVDAFTIGTTSAVTTYDFEPTNQPTKDKQCRNDGWKQFNAPAFASQRECQQWVNAEADGNLHMSGPSQKIIFHLTNVSSHDGDRHDKSTIEYWNYDYPGGLHYTANALCVNINPQTKDARFMYQIPAGHPGLSDLYVVAYVKEGAKHQPDLYGHTSTADKATAQQWCETGVGFAPAMYTVTKGHVEIGEQD